MPPASLVEPHVVSEDDLVMNISEEAKGESQVNKKVELNKTVSRD